MNPEIVSGLMLYFVFLYSTVVHEAGHAWAAYRMGDSTAYLGGQVSLDPIPHMRRAPFGMVVVPLITLLTGNGMFGWASAPYDPNWALRFPKRAAWMAMAGPAGNLLIILGSALLIRVGYHAGWFHPGTVSFSTIVAPVGGSQLVEFAAMFLSMAFSLNLLLMTFNLLPLPTFDGSAIPLFFLNGDAAEKYQRAMWNPNFRIIGLVVAVNVFSGMWGKIYLSAATLLYPG